MSNGTRIKIKRSPSSNPPSSLEVGELAYSYGTGLQDNGGERLYFGTDIDVTVIGGKYFTDLLDHVPGELTPNSAILVDENSRINNLKIDNIDIDGNTISSTTGDIVVSSERFFRITGNSAFIIPVGSIVQRPGAGSREIGMLRFNTSDGNIEVFNGTAWVSGGEGGDGGGVDESVARQLAVEMALMLG